MIVSGRKRIRGESDTRLRCYPVGKVPYYVGKVPYYGAWGTPYRVAGSDPCGELCRCLYRTPYRCLYCRLYRVVRTATVLYCHVGGRRSYEVWRQSCSAHHAHHAHHAAAITSREFDLGKAQRVAYTVCGGYCQPACPVAHVEQRQCCRFVQARGPVLIHARGEKLCEEHTCTLGAYKAMTWLAWQLVQ